MTNFFTRQSILLLVVMCAISFGIMVSVSSRDGAIVDELAHIPAGYAYVHYLDYRLNPEHPPLLKALAVLPLSFLKLTFPLDNPFWTTAVNGEWGVGGAFLYGLGNNAAQVLQFARIVPIAFTIMLIIGAYLWTRRLWGAAWALMPAALLAFSPLVISQGHYVTTDIAAAFGVMLGLFTFATYVHNPTTRNLWIAGVAFGIAELMKFSTVLLAPVYFVLICVFYLAVACCYWNEVPRKRFRFFVILGLRRLGALIAIFAIGTLLVIYPVYALFTAGYPQARQMSDTVSTVGWLTSKQCTPLQSTVCAAQFDVWAAGYAPTRPIAEYVLGVLMVSERITGTDTTYFMGHVYHQSGSYLYFPVTFGLKETIPTLIIIIGGLLISMGLLIRSVAKKTLRLGRSVLEHFPQFAMITFVGVYWATSIASPLNIGVRHLLPTIPLIYILATGALKMWFNDAETRGNVRVFSGVFLGILLVWFMGETAYAYPYYTSYVNEFGGGVMNGYRAITDSNYDWGQDMPALQTWMTQHPEVDSLALDFFGASNPAYYLGARYSSWQPSMGNPTLHGVHWFAVSINNLQLAIQPPAEATSTTPSEYQWLLENRPKEPGMGGVPVPDYRVGTTIFIYKL